MTTKVKTRKFRTFSEFQSISDSNALNENLGRITEKNGPLSGSGVLFSPLPGFYLGHCGPLKADSGLRQKTYYDEPVFVAILVLDGSCRYTMVNGESSSLSLGKNMFLAGYWDHVDVEVHIPKQDAYSHIGFFFTKSALETYFGKTAGEQIRDLIRQKGDCGHTVAGLAPQDTVFRAHRVRADTKNCTVSDMLALRGVALNHFVSLVNNVSLLGADPAQYPPHQTDVQRIAQLKQYIDDHFLDIRTVRNLGARFGMSFSKANNLFKKLHLVTIAQYVHDYKMAYAYSRLVSGKCNVTECAMEVGYSNISHFISSFKKRYRVTPKAATRLKSPAHDGHAGHCVAGN